MISIAKMYLHNLAKRVMSDGKVYPAEVVNAPKIIDKVYGDGNGILDLSDVDDVISNLWEEVTDKVDTVIDVLSSIL